MRPHKWKSHLLKQNQPWRNPRRTRHVTTTDVVCLHPFSHWETRCMLKFLSYSDSKNPFHTNPKCGVRSAPPYSVGILLSFGGVIHSTYPWLQECSLGHVIWATGCRDMINLKQQYCKISYISLLVDIYAQHIYLCFI